MALVSRLLDLRIVDQLTANRRNFIATACLVVTGVGFQMLVGSEGQVIGLPLTILGTVAASGLVYLAALLLAWRLESYPRGPEQEIMGLFRKLRVLRLRRA